jgi:hypothetical protein
VIDNNRLGASMDAEAGINFHLGKLQMLPLCYFCPYEFVVLGRHKELKMLSGVSTRYSASRK